MTIEGQAVQDWLGRLSAVVDDGEPVARDYAQYDEGAGRAMASAVEMAVGALTVLAIRLRGQHGEGRNWP